MFSIPDMTERFFASERMDNLNGPEHELFQTLDQFKTVNFLFSRTRALVKKYLLPQIEGLDKKEIVVADIGAGGGDFALWLTRLCKQKNIRVRVLCIDHDPRAVRYARARCRGHDSITVIQAPAAAIDSIAGPIDFIFSNHFLHHIQTSEIPELLAKFYHRALQGLLIVDLARSRRAYFGFTMFCTFFFRSTCFYQDGLLSIRKGFLKKELAGLATLAALPAPVMIGSLPPGRIFLHCKKPGACG